MATIAQRYTGKMMGIFVTFDPKISREPGKPVHGFYYMDVDLNGNFKTFDVSQPSAFDPSNSEMNWFYGPQKEGSGVWSSLIDVYTNEVTLDYNSFVEIDNTNPQLEVYAELKILAAGLDTNCAILFSSRS